MESHSDPTTDPDTAPQRYDDSRMQAGTLFGICSYGATGLLPLYFHMLAQATALEILAHRIVWSMLFCLTLNVVQRDMSWITAVAKQTRQLGLIVLATVLLAINWITFIYAVSTGNVVESALGEFIIPLVVVTLGVVLLGERLRRLQWVAIALGGIAVLSISFGYGNPPWIAFSLAISFSLYGFVKKKIGTNLGALQSMTIETALMTPFALATIIWIENSGQATFTTTGISHSLLMVGTGIVTAVPLILFAAAARRIPLATMGLLQFLTPILQFISGVFILGEIVPTSRWIGFGFVWAALVILTVDTFRNARRRRPVAAAEALDNAAIMTVGVAQVASAQHRATSGSSGRDTTDAMTTSI